MPGARFWLYTRWGEQVRRLAPLTATHRQQINSEDELVLELEEPLAKGDRVLWNDGSCWYEHVLSAQEQEHEGGQRFEATCVQALQADLSLEHVRLWVAKGVTAAQAASTLLAPTAWVAHDVDGEATADLTFERASVYEALLSVCGAFGLEMQAVLTVGGGGVLERGVRLVESLGSDGGARFDYSGGLRGVTKEVLDDEMFSACYGYGATLDTETDGVRDRLWCLVEDEEAVQWAGRPDGHGSATHTYGMFEDSSIESADELRVATAAHLRAHRVPAVSYECDIPTASLRGVRLGDVVQVVDREFTPALRLEARVGELERDLLGGEETRVTFGTVSSLLPDALIRMYSDARSSVLRSERVIGDVSAIGSKVDGIDGMLRAGSLSIGDSTLTVSEGRIYLDGRELAMAGETS